MFDLVQFLLNVIYFISLYYTVFWLITYLEEYKKEDANFVVREWPKVSIIIPMYNEEENIKSTIDTLCAIDYPKDKLKIIVVDDGSKDNSYKFAEQSIKENKKKYPNLSFVLLRQENQGKYKAVNHGLEYVDTDFFATLDADSYPEKDTLRKLVRILLFSDEKLAAVTPILKVYRPENTIQKIQWFEYAINHFYKSILSLRNAIHTTPGPFSLYRTKVVKELGGFREGHKTEDMEIAMRMQKHHYRIIQCDDAIVHTKAPATFKALLKQRIRWNFGTLLNVIDYRDMLFNKAYADFGLFQLVMIPLSGVLSVGLVLLLLLSLREKIKLQYLSLKAYNFNIFEMYWDSIKHFNLRFWFLNLDLRSIVMMIVFSSLMIFVLYKGIKLFREKINFKNELVPFVVYVFWYFYFLALVWFIVFKNFLFKKDIKWR